jgi:hypothetical protein
MTVMLASLAFDVAVIHHHHHQLLLLLSCCQLYVLVACWQQSLAAVLGTVGGQTATPWRQQQHT